MSEVKFTDVKKWANSNWQYRRLIPNYKVILMRYAAIHPTDVVVDSPSEYRFEETLGGQKVMTDHGKRVIDFTLMKNMIHGLAKQYGWTKNMPAIGLNEIILQRAIELNFMVRVTTKNGVFLISCSAMKLSMEKNWIGKKIMLSGMKIYAIPIQLTQREHQTKKKASSKLDDYL